MAKKNSRNTDILKDSKDTTSPKIYSILVNLVNNDREDLAEDVLKIDYLLDYTNRCIKAVSYTHLQHYLQYYCLLLVQKPLCLGICLF